MSFVKLIAAVVLTTCTLEGFAQEDVPTFKASAASALVWDNNSAQSSASSTIWDPLTGNEIHRLSAGGVEVSSRVGYERVSPSTAGKLLNFTTTIANNTESDLSVRYGGARIEGRVAPLLWVAPARKDFNDHDRKEVWDLSRMYCFKSGFASVENFFSGHAPKTFTVRPNSSMTISFVARDPRTSSAQCSVDGCHITGTIRYYITVNHKDFVFVWPGRSVVYCGE